LFATPFALVRDNFALVASTTNTITMIVPVGSSKTDLLLRLFVVLVASDDAMTMIVRRGKRAFTAILILPGEQQDA
jgi:hypothetical protein